MTTESLTIFGIPREPLGPPMSDWGTTYSAMCGDVLSVVIRDLENSDWNYYVIAGRAEFFPDGRINCANSEICGGSGDSTAEAARDCAEAAVRELLREAMEEAGE